MMIRSAPPCSANLAVMPGSGAAADDRLTRVQRGPQAPQGLSAWDVRHGRVPFVRVRRCWETLA